MNKFWKGVLINLGVAFGLCLFFVLLDPNAIDILQIAPAIIAFYEFFIAVILVIIPKTRFVGKVMLLSTGIIFLIGLSICSVYPLKF